MVQSGVSGHGLACCGLVWRVADWGGVVRSVLVWFDAEHTSLVWCSTVVDVLMVGRGRTTLHLAPELDWLLFDNGGTIQI